MKLKKLSRKPPQAPTPQAKRDSDSNTTTANHFTESIKQKTIPIYREERESDYIDRSDIIDSDEDKDEDELDDRESIPKKSRKPTNSSMGSK